jgi:hypothetical protein
MLTTSQRQRRLLTLLTASIAGVAMTIMLMTWVFPNLVQGQFSGDGDYSISLSDEVSLDSDAAIYEPSDAAATSVDLAKNYLQATEPRVTSVELLRLEDALIAAQEVMNEPAELAMAGVDPSDADIAVWRVVMEGETFHIPRCPAPIGEQDEVGPGDGCGSSTAAIYTFRAHDGVGVALQLPGAD